MQPKIARLKEVIEGTIAVNLDLYISIRASEQAQSCNAAEMYRGLQKFY